MTKQDFIAIAAVINRLPRDESHVEPGFDKAYIADIVTAFADFCATQNPRFDRERFLAACLEGSAAVAPSRKVFDRKRAAR